MTHLRSSVWQSLTPARAYDTRDNSGKRILHVRYWMEAKAFSNVRGQIGYCGIWCGSCVVGNGTLKELTRRYEDLLRAYGLDHWGPEGFEFDRFTKDLQSIQGVSSCCGCRKGGGRGDCPLRQCALTKGLEGCHVCPDVETCEHKDDLEHMRSGALKAGLFVNTERADPAELIGRWTEDLRAQWPCSILFETDD